ncbi:MULTISPECIES: hypothetical protein [Amycolatopsis]|uniref:Uncharacterized protein n=2 Tax=Amycolatopsis methanolica group TaxID=2893674 RepID=A0A076MPT0_AMYME|nr:MULTISPECIES: hypothetical protein [Amycolatopsis methanolica group]AIJ22649.1 hypothetical protein AMETH_2557 [Amycolatopsis methanolica 239]ROS38261.1 hypothetical protein EDD35_0531 [Amycolatopsis thermoflava]
MNDKDDEKKPVSPEPPLSPDFPDVRHPDLDMGPTEDVEKPPNTEEVKPEEGIPEPPD